ncbi:hypothetical protein PI124_g18471 [Phytophthora idaei]|nr:hypothetical protein PI125_g19621 [Phytophthora idaei]KAG3138766.1 hypothetical protein PI126_g16761 [Phytophthora idaei]KAG3236520.1 hypothetical protein PI124_g18471 [Phytophthora idaei]
MSNNGVSGQMYTSQPEESTGAPMTAIATYGGYTLNGVPGTPGFGFGNPVFQPMAWAEIARQQRALQSQLKYMQLKEAPQIPATSAPTLVGFRPL